jgi:hypothetical protein
MAAEIAELVKQIGCEEEELRRLLKVDQPYITNLIASGYSQAEAENISFIGDLRKMLSILKAHSSASAAAILKQHWGAPYGFVSTETEGEDDEQVANNQERQLVDNEVEQEGDADSSNLSSSSSGYAHSMSLSSSTEDEVEAKLRKLDPDYVPSVSSSSSTTPAVTAPNSRVTSDAEEETEEDETDAESYVPSDTTEEETEPSDTTEEETERSDEEDEDGEL